MTAGRIFFVRVPYYVCCSPRCRIGSGQTSEAAEGPGHAAGCRHDSWLPPYRVIAGCRRGGRGRGGRDTRLDATTTAGCRRAAWVAGCRRGGRGRGVGEGGCRSASVRPGKGCGAEHVCCSPRCRLGSGKTSEAAEGASSGGKGWRKGGYTLGSVAPRGIGIDRRITPTSFGLEEGWRSLGRVGTCSRVHRLD